jgi:hypothetical protein
MRMLAIQRSRSTTDLGMNRDLDLLSQAQGVKLPWPSISRRWLRFDPGNDAEFALAQRASGSVGGFFGIGRGERDLLLITVEHVRADLTDEESTLVCSRLADHGLDPTLLKQERVVILSPSARLASAVIGVCLSAALLVHELLIGSVLAILALLFFAFLARALAHLIRLHLKERVAQRS